MQTNPPIPAFNDNEAKSTPATTARSHTFRNLGLTVVVGILGLAVIAQKLQPPTVDVSNSSATSTHSRDFNSQPPATAVIDRVALRADLEMEFDVLRQICTGYNSLWSAIYNANMST